ncbi:hypothetical protein L226DRAFT_432330, partial [Lentinus tigrinus ALCF2SS1-7]|uniref:uncharacterized protein n=1 Tax=Lentinus tigrinus ALCF2SS1-7 TaxID=1328758 RepID=UPI0011662335
HPDATTHILRKRVVWVVPVILGPHVPRSDRSDEERQDWARIILLLFLPWRSPADLKHNTETWYQAYTRQQTRISSHHQSIIHNISVLNECRDARDKARQRR